MKLANLLLFIISVFSSTLIYSQTLNPGDIAVVGYNATNPDELALVCFTDISAGTQIKITDNGWLSSGGFRNNEGTFTYSFPSNILAGTITNPILSSVAFSGSGDQVLIYQGEDLSPTFIFGFNNEGEGVWQEDAISANTSAIPFDLINGESAVAINETQNVIYIGTTSGTRSELLTAICNKINWSGSNTTRQIMPSVSFTIDGGSATIPTPPIAIDASNISSNSFTANWQASTGATSYSIDVSELSDFSNFISGYENLNVGNISNYSIANLNFDTDYFYRVRASNSAGTSDNSNVIAVKTDFQQSTIVQFSKNSSSVLETGGSINIRISISNPDASNPTTANVVLVNGDAADIENYTTQIITFPAGSSTEQLLTIAITDDGITEGNETLTFEIQNMSGGYFATVGTESQFNLTIIEKAGGDYYDNIDPNSTTFLSDLKNRIRIPYNYIPYSQYDETNIADFASKDNGDGTRSVFCVYSNFEYKYSGTFVWDVLSREHTFPHSWMPTNPADTPIERDEYSDQHHLFPANQDQANSVRSNHPFGNVTNISSTFLDAKFGTDEDGNIVYEPRDAHKGDAARAILYMIIRYDDIDGYDWGLNWVNAHSGRAPQDYKVLLDWHELDPPDEWEMERNNYVQSIQGNRNPFVDHPEYVNYIDFEQVEYLSNSLFFTEYVEGSSDNKALEIFNKTGSTIDLAADGYKIEIYSNGGTSSSYSVNLNGNLVDGDVFVISNTAADQVILDISDQTSGSINFNGDDAIALFRGDQVVDVIGQIGFDPGDEWGSGDISTQNNTLKRRSSIGVGDMDGTDVFDPNIEWLGFTEDTFNGLGTHTINAGPPIITMLNRNPKIPLEDENTLISSNVIDDGSIGLVKIKFKIDGGVEQEIIATNTTNATYAATIPNSFYTDGNLLEYWVYAEDKDEAASSSSHQKVFTGTTTIAKVKTINDEGRLNNLDTYARISGIATVASEVFSTDNLDVYIQDDDGGINIFKYGEITNIIQGNSYIVEGLISQYYGKAEIIPDDLTNDISDLGIVSVRPDDLNKSNSINEMPEPIVKTISEFLLNAESYEGMLIGIKHVTNTNGGDAWPVLTSNANIEITDDGGTTKYIIRVDKDTEIDGTTEPAWPKDVVGILTQYDSSPPYDFGYQILPRDLNDIQNDGALPAELSTFTAFVIENEIQLIWETETEVNNYGFDVERQKSEMSSHKAEWKKVAFIEGLGNSDSKRNYSFIDKTADISGKYNYRLKQIDIDGGYKYTESIEVEIGIPNKFEVAQNYPNPFNPTTTISYSIPERSKVQITIYNVLGQLVKKLLDKEQLPGKYKLSFDASSLSSGTYIYKVSAGENIKVRKMVLIK